METAISTGRNYEAQSFQPVEVAVSTPGLAAPGRDKIEDLSLHVRTKCHR